MQENDIVNVSGPYGRWFPVENLQYNDDILIVGGGTGIAPLAYLSQKLENHRSINFLGAKTIDEVIMTERFCGDVHISTDDGSYGRNGLVTDLLQEYFKPDFRKILANRLSTTCKSFKNNWD